MCSSFLTMFSTLTQIPNLTHSHTVTPFDAPEKQAFENIVGNGENAGNQHFLLFPQCFLFYQRQKYYFVVQFVVYKCFPFDLVQNFVVGQLSLSGKKILKTVKKKEKQYRAPDNFLSQGVFKHNFVNDRGKLK